MKIRNMVVTGETSARSYSGSSLVRMLIAALLS